MTSILLAGRTIRQSLIASTYLSHLSVVRVRPRHAQHQIVLQGTVATDDDQDTTDQSQEVPPKPFSDIPQTKRVLGFNIEQIKDPFRNIQYFRRQFQVLDTPIFRNKPAPGIPEMVVIQDPSDIERVFRVEGKYPQRIPFTDVIQSRKELNIPLGVFFREGEEWHKQRAPMSKYMMMPQRIAEYHEPFNQVALDFVDLVRRERGPNDLLSDASESMYRWSFESVCLFVLGRRLGCLDSEVPTECADLINNLQLFMETLQKLMFGAIPLHKIWSTNNWKALLKSTEKIYSLPLTCIKEKLQSLDSDSEEAHGVDFVTSMILAGNMTVEDVAVNSSDLIVGGVDTTGGTLLWCLYLLATCPEAQDYLRQEVNEVVGVDEVITPQHIADMHYLRGCFKETQRLYPISPFNARTLKDDVVLSGYNIPAGMIVYMPIAITGTLPTLFDEPEKFKPERWSRENKMTSNVFATLPFGFGTRMCIGRRVAELELNIALSQLIRNFKIEYRDEKPMDYIAKFLLFPERQLDLAFVDI